MIPKNEMNLTDRDVATLIAKKMYNTTTNKSDFSIQLFVEQLVLPKDCENYDLDTLIEYIMNFMDRN